VEKSTLSCLQVDKGGQFKEDGFQKAMALAGSNSATQIAVKQKKKTDQGEDSDIYKLVQILVERCLDPVCSSLTALSKIKHVTCAETGLQGEQGLQGVTVLAIDYG
jgi:hypothetical protein